MAGPAAGPQWSANWGGKALLVCILAVLMGIPGLLVYSLIVDRQGRAQSVTEQVSSVRGGPQRLLGPVLVAPYVTVDDKGKTNGSGWWVVSAQSGTADLKVQSATLHRGIFDVPVYDTVALLTASFAPVQTAAAPPGMRIDWTQARVVLGFTDLRGAKSDINGVLSGKAGQTVEAFTPFSSTDPNLQSTSAPDQSGQTPAPFGLVAAPAASIVSSPSGAVLKVRLQFTGAGRLSVMPFAKSTAVTMSGDWPSPSFDGGFLPAMRRISQGHFVATWSIPFVARGLSDQGTASAVSLGELAVRDVGVTFARANNPYVNVGRSLKYGIMFVGLVFLTFFVFEALSGRPLHPAQYVLIGLAQMVFYLLLLSISEYLGFDIGFAFAGVATVGLIGLYAGWAFRSARYRWRALVIFSILYALIYCLMRLEDFALLAGSLASFTGLAAAMYLTRHLEWYGGRPPQKAEPAATPTISAPST